MWCIGRIDGKFRACMYDVLDLYAEPYDPKRPIIGFDEKPKQLIADSRKLISMKPGSPEKYDYEYKRNGTANIFVAVEPKAGKRRISVTDRRTKKDFAHEIKHLVDFDYRNADLLRIVLDNLNTHKKESLYETFEKEEAERILRKVDFHYTPKHGSWLNIAEIEINVMDTECTGRRMKTKGFLASEVNAWAKARNRARMKIEWSFTRREANKKLRKHYVS